MKGKLVKTIRNVNFRGPQSRMTIPPGTMGVVVDDMPPQDTHARVRWFNSDYPEAYVHPTQLEFVETAKPLRGRPFKEKVDENQG